MLEWVFDVERTGSGTGSETVRDAIASQLPPSRVLQWSRLWTFRGSTRWTPEGAEWSSNETSVLGGPPRATDSGTEGEARRRVEQ